MAARRDTTLRNLALALAATLAMAACDDARLTGGTSAAGPRGGTEGPPGTIYIPPAPAEEGPDAAPGELPGPADPVDPDDPLPAFAPAPPTLHRLTRAQYEVSLRDLLGADLPLPPDLEADTPLHGFSTIGAAELTISPHAAEQLEAAARDAAAHVFGDAARREALVGCAPASVDDPCVRAFFERFGRRAWRRPPTGDELDALQALAAELAATFRDPWRGLEHAVAAMLQSPYFLFRVEQGEPDPEATGRLRYTSWEMAARLAFLLWGAPPDDALLDAAARDELVTDAGLAAQLDRMLDDPRTRDAVARFFVEYLNLDRLASMTKDAEVFPQMGPALVAAMRQEVLSVIDELVFARDADFRSLLDTRQTFVDAELAALYGLPAPAEPGFHPAELPADGPRGGLMGMAAMLALNAHATVTSPTLRGRFIQANLRCFDIPPPPPGVITSLPEDDGEQGPRTVREKLEAHRSDPTCAACHRHMDPMGLGLENFDALGVYRTTDNGLPVDARSAVDGAPFEGARELGRLLRDDPSITECVARRLYRYGTGHLELESEERAVYALADAFAASGFRFRALLRALVLSEGFRSASAEEPALEEDAPEEEGDGE